MKITAKRVLIAFAICASFLASIEVVQIMKGSNLSSSNKKVEREKFAGVWRSRGYGWVWSIKNKRIYSYDEGPSYCIKTPFSEEALSDLGDDAQFSEDGRTMRVSLGDITYQYTFDKIDRLPESCNRNTDKSAVAVFDALTDLFSTHYTVFKSRNINWQSLVAEARKDLADDMGEEELFHILKDLLSNVEDDHVSLEAEIDGEEFHHNPGEGMSLLRFGLRTGRSAHTSSDLIEYLRGDAWNESVRRTLFLGAGDEAAGGLIRFGLVDGDIGFISILGMEDFAGEERKELAAVDKVMDRAMKLFEDVKAVVVDVSLNDGGYDSVARHIAGRFAAERTLAYSKYAGDDAGAKPQPAYIEPSKKRRYLGPVFLLTSDVTVSAAEIFTLSMRSLANVVHVGGTTRGSLSDALWKRLPNKWTASLSNEIYLDSDGKSWEGSGIPPQFEFDVFAGNDPGKALLAAVDKIIKMIRLRETARSS